MSDEKLMLLYARQRDAGAFRKLAERYQLPVLHFITQSISDRQTARELTQDTFMAVIKLADKYKPTAKFSTLIFSIARRRCIDSIRKSRPLLTLDAPAFHKARTTRVSLLADETIPLADKSVDHSRFLRALAEEVSDLPNEQRRVFQSKIFQGLKYREIAHQEGASLGTVKSRMRLALEKLRKKLSPFRPLLRRS
jgi:RNA polymerase sigma-70 factor (ECF subfamily)